MSPRAHDVWTRALLAVAALASIAVGMALLFVPSAFRAYSGNTTPTAPGELSEIRAPAGALLSIGVALALGAQRSALRGAALFAACATFLGYGGGRLVSAALDGMPPHDLVLAGIVEIVLGVAALVGLISLPDDPHARAKMPS